MFIIGILISMMGLAMIVPALVDAVAGYRDWATFAVSSASAIFISGLLILSSAGSPIQLRVRQAFLLITLSWISLSAVGALPLGASVESSSGLGCVKASVEPSRAQV